VKVTACHLLLEWDAVKNSADWCLSSTTTCKWPF